VQNAVWRNVETKARTEPWSTREFEKFEPGVGSVTPAQYDEFVRDTVNFLHTPAIPRSCSARPRHLGDPVPSHVHGHRVHAEEGILEGRPLNGYFRAGPRFPGRDVSVEPPCHDDAVLGAR
jgi:hypothetical protein